MSAPSAVSPRPPGNVAGLTGWSRTEQLYTIPVTCCLDGQAHNVTDESMSAGRGAGAYQALCGYLVVPAPMAAPIGRPCAQCTATVASHRPTTTPAHRPRHRRHGRLWRMLRD